jgi:glutathione S-transferase
MQFVDLEAARALDVPVMTVATVLPSPWSEAAKSIFHVKKIDIPLVRFRSTDPEVAKWSGMNNAPVLLSKGEPRRTAWAEILMFAERAGGAVSLVPEDDADRIRLFGVGHEIAGEGGLGYSERLLMIHGSLASNGAEGFPIAAAKYLAPKYGYDEGRFAAAKKRVLGVLDLLHRMVEKSQSEGRTYLLGHRLSALDIYLATFLTPIVGVTEQECPGMMPQLRPAFAYLKKEVGHAVTEALAAHRATIFERHLVRPIEL